MVQSWVVFSSNVQWNGSASSRDTTEFPAAQGSFPWIVDGSFTRWVEKCVAVPDTANGVMSYQVHSRHRAPYQLLCGTLKICVARAPFSSSTEQANGPQRLWWMAAPKQNMAQQCWCVQVLATILMHPTPTDDAHETIIVVSKVRWTSIVAGLICFLNRAFTVNGSAIICQVATIYQHVHRCF